MTTKNEVRVFLESTPEISITAAAHRLGLAARCQMQSDA